MTHVVGIDPGLVHTGCVRLEFYPSQREILLDTAAINGPDAQAVKAWVNRALPMPTPLAPRVFIEGYRPRSNLHQDQRMTLAVKDMSQALRHAKVLNNTGVKKVVRQPLMELLGIWRFTTVTHHQDLRSAGRIAVLGMLKDQAMNRLIADIIRDTHEGNSWNVAHRPASPLLTGQP